VDASTGDKFKEVFVLTPLWQNKMHGLDLKRCTPAEREVLEAILDPDLKDKPHRIPLVNDIKRRMDPIELIRNPVVFYTKFVKPFMRKKDIRWHRCQGCEDQDREGTGEEPAVRSETDDGGGPEGSGRAQSAEPH
jgi:hypothetical protein